MKVVAKDGGECRETLFLIAVMMSKSTHQSTEANKILLEIVHCLTKDQLCTPSIGKSCFLYFFTVLLVGSRWGRIGSASFLCNIVLF